MQPQPPSAAIGRPALAIFDLDGTLVDSVADIHAAITAMLADCGRPAPDLAALRGFVGDGARNLVARVLDHVAGPPVDLDTAVARYLGHYRDRPLAASCPYPGAAETLSRLAGAGITLAICTNKPEAIARAVLRGLALDRDLAMILGGDSLPCRKPDPRTVDAVFERTGIAAERAILVGDSEIDAATAEAARIPFILVDYGYRRGPAEAIRAAATIGRLDALPALFGL